MLEKSWLRFCSLFAFTLRLKICNPFYKLPVLLVVNQSAKKTASSTCCQSGKTTASSTCCHSMWEEDCQFYLLSEWEDNCKFYLLSFSVGRRLPVLLVVIQCGKKTASSTCCQWEEESQFYLLSIRVCSLSTSSLEMLSTCLVLWCSAISVNKEHMPQVVKQRQ